MADANYPLLQKFAAERISDFRPDLLAKLSLKDLCLLGELLRIALFELTEILKLPANSGQQWKM